jgi:hypothetical protein
VQGFDKAFPVLLELRGHCAQLEVMTVLELEDTTRIDAADFFSNLCVDLSDHIAVYDETQFSEDIANRARAANKLVHDHASCSAHSSGKITPALTAVAHRLASTLRGQPSSNPIHWAANADYLIGIYNSFGRPLADQLSRAVRSNKGRVVGYFKAINDEGRGISALDNPSVRKPPFPAKRTENIDTILLPHDSFRTLFKKNVRAQLVATGYPPFYRSWKDYVKRQSTPFGTRSAAELNVAVLTRGEVAHRRKADQIITEETLRDLLDNIYDALRNLERPFRVRLKPHPYQDVEALGRYIEEWPEATLVFDPPVVLAATADVIIAIYSSAILDGVVFGASLIEYYEENSAFRRLHSTGSPFGSFGVAIARTRSELDAALKNAFLQRRSAQSDQRIEEANALAQRLPELFSLRD